jgi:hypothetical protein
MAPSELIPQPHFILRAVFVACLMSHDTLVVIAPETSSSAIRPSTILNSTIGQGYWFIKLRLTGQFESFRIIDRH